MANLNVDQLSQIVQSGNIEQLFKGSMSSAGVGSESIAAAEIGAHPSSATLPPDSAKGFSDILRESVDKVNLQQVEADRAVKELVAGRNKNIHETMLTIERADTSLKLMMQVRNKILDAYKEIMRMQV